MIRAVAHSGSLDTTGLNIAVPSVTPHRHFLNRETCRRSPPKTDTNPKRTGAATMIKHAGVCEATGSPVRVEMGRP